MTRRITITLGRSLIELFFQEKKKKNRNSKKKDKETKFVIRIKSLFFIFV